MTDTKNAPPKTPQKPAIRFGEPEKTNWKKIILAGTFVVLGVAGIVWMIVASPRQHALSCDTNGSGFWGAMGRCHED
jgi:hypothetical protein